MQHNRSLDQAFRKEDDKEREKIGNVRGEMGVLLGTISSS